MLCLQKDPENRKGFNENLKAALLKIYCKMLFYRELKLVVGVCVCVCGRP